MLLRFTKMHGCGNDFMVLDRVSQFFKLRPSLVRKWSDRRTGIGFDQLLVAEAPQNPDADFFYRIYNADGSEARQCGNGARCFARFVRERGLTRKNAMVLQTSSGNIEVEMLGRNQARVNMGEPILNPADIPFQAEQRATSYNLEVGDRNLDISAVSMGNPHAVWIVDDTDSVPVAELGPLIENHVRFPERVNAGFMQLLNRAEIRLRVYERGAGETLACGTGACAAVVAGQLRGLLEQEVLVHLAGGTLTINWGGEGTTLSMSGPCVKVYEGRIYL